MQTEKRSKSGDRRLKGEDRKSKGEEMRSRGDDRKSKGENQRWVVGVRLGIGEGQRENLFLRVN